jgi:hypothetical protein
MFTVSPLIQNASAELDKKAAAFLQPPASDEGGNSDPGEPDFPRSGGRRTRS